MLVGPLREDVSYRKYPKGLRSKLVSTLELQRLVRQGHPLNLCHISEEGKKEVGSYNIVIVREFVDVFREEIPNMPPQQLINFTIDLLRRTGSISKAQYRMAPKEMEELKS